MGRAANIMAKLFAGVVDDPAQADWTQLAGYVRDGESEAAAAWCDRYGVGRPAIELVALALDEKTRLEQAWQDGQTAAEQLADVVRLEGFLQRVVPATLDEAERHAEKLAECQSRKSGLVNTRGLGEAAGGWLRFLNQQFGCLWGVESRLVDGTCPPALTEWFAKNSVDPYMLHAWQRLGRHEQQQPRRLRAV